MRLIIGVTNFLHSLKHAAPIGNLAASRRPLALKRIKPNKNVNIYLTHFTFRAFLTTRTRLWGASQLPVELRSSGIAEERQTEKESDIG